MSVAPSADVSWEAARRAGDHGAALTGLRDALRRRQLPAERLVSAGQYLAKAFDATPAEGRQLTVRLLGQCTTSFLAPTLAAEGLAHGARLSVTDGEYDNVIQELAALDERPDAVVLLPWHQRLLAGDDRSAAQRVDDELAFIKQAQQMIADRGARLVQVGYDAFGPGPLGYCLSGSGGAVRLVRDLNAALRADLPQGAYFVDLEQIAGQRGRDAFYDMRNYAWTKQPFSAAGLADLARHAYAGVRAVTTGPKKALVLDLDNTLWGGVVGELGPCGVALGDSPDGEAFRAFQRHVKQLAQRGVVLAVCSKNTAPDARGPFEQNPDMVLKLDDIAAFEASWDPKPQAIRRIAETLRLGLDSFVFFDDNPAEREHVLQELPEVAVVAAPRDPVDYVRALEAGLWFEAAALSDADRQRGAQYRAEGQRRQAQQTAGDLGAYLTSLEMRATVAPIDDVSMQRVAQLLAKTNQFNLTTRRHTDQDVRRMLAEVNALGLTMKLVDRFGDYGLISVVLGVADAEADAPTLRLDTWLMSCRAISRTAEDFLMRRVVERARELGYARVVGEYIPTPKNGLVAEMYPRFGFVRLDDGGDGVQRFELALSAFKPTDTYVQPGE